MVLVRGGRDRFWCALPHRSWIAVDLKGVKDRK
jgi:hypothetical protein